MRIDLIYDRTCPNVDRARAMIRQALLETGSVQTWTEWDRDDIRTPVELRVFGSPTVLVNGRDVDGDKHEDARADANCCRIYVDEFGCVCTAPSAALIASAINGTLAARADEKRQKPTVAA